MRKKPSVVSLLVTVALLAGCTTVDPAAFKPNKRYAVVSFYYNHNLYANSAREKVVDRNGRTLDTEPYVRRIAGPFLQKFLPAFAGASPFKVTYGPEVLRTRAYAKAAPTSGASLIAFKPVPVGGYHVYQMDQTVNLGQLARDLNVDGVLVIYHHFFMIGEGTLSNANPAITSVIVAFDRDGNKVLQEYTQYTCRRTVKAAKSYEVDVNGIAKAIVDEADSAGRNLARYIAEKIRG